jgi:hypothetical protein
MFNGGVVVQIHIVLNSALVGGEWSASRPSSFTPGEGAPGNHWIGGWVGDAKKRKIHDPTGIRIPTPQSPSP